MRILRCHKAKLLRIGGKANAMVQGTDDLDRKERCVIPKKVFLGPPWKMQAGQPRMVAFPPAGYEFVVKETAQEKVFKAATRWDFPRFLLRSYDVVLPTGLVKSWLERSSRPPTGCVLTYAVDPLVFRSEPWV